MNHSDPPLHQCQTAGYQLILSAAALLWAGSVAVVAAGDEPAKDPAPDNQSTPNTLTKEEEAAGWKLLFDGESLSGWRRYRSEDPPADGWTIEDGTLHKQAGKRPGDIMTVATYGDFEFAWEWRLEAGGNNGVKYFITPERGAAIGHEYQMIDDARVSDAFSSNASFYLVVEPRADKPNRPMGEWNSSRIVVRGERVEHWLNGAKVLEYDCGSPEVMARVPETKFRDIEGFGTKIRGHILLTDHQDPCWFRNLKVRPLK